MINEQIKLTTSEIQAAFQDPRWAEKFPPVLTIEQAAELFQLSVGTLRDWRSRGDLKGCCRKIGKHLRFFRDRYVRHVFEMKCSGPEASHEE